MNSSNITMVGGGGGGGGGSGRVRRKGIVGWRTGIGKDNRKVEGERKEEEEEALGGTEGKGRVDEESERTEGKGRESTSG